MKKTTIAISLAAMMLLGTILTAPRNSYAHTFAGDESAAFLLLVESIRVELDLVESNFASNATLAEEHAEHANGYLDYDIIKEIEERNERLATDLPAALEDLHHSIADSTEQQVQTKIQNINDLLGETVTVRVEPDQLTNSTIQALVMANMLVDISFMGHGHYEIALGIGEEHTHEEEHDEHDGEHEEEHDEDEHDEASEDEHDEEMSSNETGSHSMTEGPVEIVDMAHYQTAQAFAVRAQELWTELKTEAPPTVAHEISEIDAALPDLIEALNDKASNADVQLIIHGRIHPNMITAFGLELEGHTEEHDEHEEHETHSNISEKLMMYAEETGEHIHEEHLAENAPINGMYGADTRYTLTLTGEAIPVSHDSMEESMHDDNSSMAEDAELMLELATWKSTGRVLHMDVTGGSVTVGDETMAANSGQVYYITNARVMFAFVVVMPEGGDGESVHILRLSAVLAPDGELPASGSDQPLDIISTRSTRSDWQLEMSGQVALS